MKRELYNKRRKRAAIAKDALMSILSGRMGITKGRYIVRKGGIETLEQTYTFEKMETKCEFCALGSLMVTACLRDPEGMLPEISGRNLHSIFSNGILYKLSPMFGAVQLRLIELAFEGKKDLTSLFDDTETVAALVEEFYSNPEPEYAVLTLEELEKRALNFYTARAVDGLKDLPIMVKHDERDQFQAKLLCEILTNIIDNKGVFLP